MVLILLILPLLTKALDATKSDSSDVHRLENFFNVSSILELLPKECVKNGEKYQEGEEFQSGHLRYKCQKHGVYTIEGCITDKKKNLKIGEIVVIDNVKFQCMAKGNSVFYRETVCGILGQPDCDKVGLPSGFNEAKNNDKIELKGKQINIPGLPRGWTAVDESLQEIPGSNGKHVVSRTLMFRPIIEPSRVRRQSGSVFGILNGQEKKKPSVSMSKIMSAFESSSSNVNDKHSSQSLSQHLKIANKNKEQIVGIGIASRGIHKRTATVNANAYKPGTVAGTHSDVKWSGKTISVNGRKIAAGPGTFTFGTSPTGSFLKKED
ncbi:hypothetical protein DICVIV_02949 [Dictyocaulus viviparus]|uniref:Abnormal cell migration protein 18-like fibronectin type I domain-containing protein n=1 Tax=Dictyocaulus viviparus TaxID=29172 RepID=A0A0D8Y2G3_DICVI|nr:hypothetical protein DICVIV_02949 [Dictyocaulus viviparus]